jgi:hypothetical protein
VELKFSSGCPLPSYAAILSSHCRVKKVDHVMLLSVTHHKSLRSSCVSADQKFS